MKELYTMQLAKMAELFMSLKEHLNEKEDAEGVELLQEIEQQHLLLNTVLTDAINSLKDGTSKVVDVDD
jgi:hypothetical protein